MIPLVPGPLAIDSVPLARVVEGLGRKCAPALAEEPIVAWAPAGTPGFEVALAEATLGKWEEIRGVLTLVPDLAKRAAEDRRRRETVRRAIAELRKTKTDGWDANAVAQRIRKGKDEYEGITEALSVYGRTVLRTVGDRLFPDHDGPVLYSPRPGWGRVVVPEMEAGWKDVSDRLVRLAAVTERSPDAVREEWRSLRPVIRFSDGGWEVTAVRPSGEIHTAATLKFDLSEPKEPPIPGGPISTEGPVKVFRAAWTRNASGRDRRALTTIAPLLRDPVRFDPVRWSVTPGWIEAFRRRGRPIVAVAPDETMSLFRSAAVAPKELATAMNDFLLAHESGEWQIRRPRFRRERASRPGLAAAVRAIESARGLTSANWAVAGSVSDPRSGIFAPLPTLVRGLMPTRRLVAGPSWALVSSGSGLRFWAEASPSARGRWLKGEPVAFRELSSHARDVVGLAALLGIYETGSDLSEILPQGPSASVLSLRSDREDWQVGPPSTVEDVADVRQSSTIGFMLGSKDPAVRARAEAYRNVPLRVDRDMTWNVSLGDRPLLTLREYVVGENATTWDKLPEKFLSLVRAAEEQARAEIPPPPAVIPPR